MPLDKLTQDQLEGLQNRLEWLDSERRKDKTTIVRLEERLTQQNDITGQLLRRLEGLESDQTTMRERFLPASRHDELLTQIRAETHQSIEQIEDRRALAERELEKRGNIAREGITRSAYDQSNRLTTLERKVEDFPSSRIEQDRLTGIVTMLSQRVDDFAKRVEERDRSLTFLEEQRRQDSRRISELQAEIPDLQRQIERVRPKLELIEETALRNEKRVLDIQGSDRERRDQIQQFVDQQTLVIQQRDQQLADLTAGMKDYDEDMRRYTDRFETWSETYRHMKKIVADFERVSDRLERRINEVAEMQRLSEERFRQEWNEFGADDQKRWKQFTLANDETWRAHDKRYEEMNTHLDDFDERIPDLRESVRRLWDLQRAQVTILRERFAEALNEFDATASKPKPKPVLPAAAPDNSDANTPPPTT